MPNRDSIVLGLEDDAITYYSPEEGRLFYIDSGIDTYASGTGEYPSDDAHDYMLEVEAELLEAAKKKLEETGEIGLVSIEREFEFEVYAGPSHDRLDQTWDERKVTIEALFHVTEDSETWEEDDPQVIKDTLAGSRDPRAAEALQKIRAEEVSSDRQMQNHVDDLDGIPPAEPPQSEIDRMQAEAHRRDAENRAQDYAEDEGVSWDSLSEAEREKRVDRAEERLSDESVDRAEEAASPEASPGKKINVQTMNRLD